MHNTFRLALDIERRDVQEFRLALEMYRREFGSNLVLKLSP